EESFAAFAGGWRGAAASGFWSGVADVAATLRTLARESERTRRRYVLSGLPKQVRGARASNIAQGYVPGERLVEYLSRVTDNGATRLYRRVQLEEGTQRTAAATALMSPRADRSRPLTTGPRSTQPPPRRP